MELASISVKQERKGFIPTYTAKRKSISQNSEQRGVKPIYLLPNTKKVSISKHLTYKPIYIYIYNTTTIKELHFTPYNTYTCVCTCFKIRNKLIFVSNLFPLNKMIIQNCNINNNKGECI